MVVAPSTIYLIPPKQNLTIFHGKLLLKEQDPGRGVNLPIDNPAGKIVKAEVPLAEMFGYATDLRGATQGRASYSMEFAHYQEVPPAIAQGIIQRF